MPLTPSERIVLIKEISTRLGAESYSLIDMILKQFSIPTEDVWSGSSPQTYALDMIQSAPDQVLTDLAQHVGYKFESVSALRIDPPFWKKDMLRLFISHLSAHKTFACEVQHELLAFGIYGFVAHSDIEPSLEWVTQIETALATCDALVALMHSEFHKSNWTDQEIGFVMGRGIPAFSVRLGQDPYGFIGRFQAFNGSNKNAKLIARELFDAYRKNKQTRQRMGDVLVKLFEQSVSFAEAKERIAYLEELEFWTPSYSSRISSAAEVNNQISGSYYVPGRVEGLVMKWKKAGN